VLVLPVDGAGGAWLCPARLGAVEYIKKDGWASRGRQGRVKRWPWVMGWGAVHWRARVTRSCRGGIGQVPIVSSHLSVHAHTGTGTGTACGGGGGGAEGCGGGDR
jgi:hypothetical protein